PQDNKENVTIFSPITVQFSRKMTPPEQSGLSIRTTPRVVFIRQWQKDEKTLMLTPESALAENQQYTVVITFGQTTTSVSFTTTSKAGSITNNITQAGLERSDVTRQYPWFNSLPLLSGKYQVNFDLKKKVFVAKLFVYREVEVPVLEQVISDKLKGLGVDLNTYTIVWEVIR
ncbi:MAG: Ig-like domain-containing protein, partial [Candidatus Levybacteria bacterium]|nr:Ig-like domain-containing protein [Candidatus Levybacteria bacterium]